jgi:hypothetical protein
MEGVVSVAPAAALATVLRAGRSDFNQRFKLAQQQYRALTGEDWQHYLRHTLGPVAAKVRAHDADRVAAVINVLYDQGMPMVAQNWLGAQARVPELAAAYCQLLTALTPALTRDPARVSGALLNALYQISQHDVQSIKPWADRLAALAGALDDTDTVLCLGTVLAWRIGLAAYRAAALQAAAALPPPLVQAALALPQPPAAALWQALQRAPTLRPDEVGVEGLAKMNWLGWCGGFRGLGGPFAQMPVIGIAGNKLAASDGEHTWWLAADGYGLQCVRMGRAADWSLQRSSQTGSEPVQVSAAGEVRARTHSETFNELASATACVWHNGILAVTLRTSYQVSLLRFAMP